MKQIFLNASQVAEVIEVDVPRCGPREVLVAVAASLISTGTETAGYDAGGPLARGLRHPSKLGMLVESVRDHGVQETWYKVKAKGEELRPLGYSGAGTVVQAGSEVRALASGDRVAYVGAPHAEYVVVGENQAARLPPEVAFLDAAFGALACIALHGVRLGEPTLGERAVVIGLGLVGLLVMQFARACGMTVVGVDPLCSRRELARGLGIKAALDPSVEPELPQSIAYHTGGLGADVVYLCAGVKDSRVTNDALAAARDRARVVMIGDMGLDLDRRSLFGKELSFRVSRSYGPGRYDRQYEERGVDYPIGYVRWTEKRNLACFLDLLALGVVRVDPLASLSFPVEQATAAYTRLVADPKLVTAVVLTYGKRTAEPPKPSPICRRVATRSGGQLRIGVIGCGAFVRANLLPHLRPLGARLYGVANRSPAAFPVLVSRYAPDVLTTESETLITDPAVDAFIVGTRHNLHGPLAEAVLRAGKPVHVEKPMTMTLAEAEGLAQLVREHDGLLTVGFNRRFAPAALALREALAGAPRPRQFLYRVNALPIPPGHWSLDPVEGGGRLLGEGCHFIDLLCHLAESEVSELSGGTVAGEDPLTSGQDNFAITLRFLSGDLGTVIFSGQGSAALAKERLEVFAGGRVYVIDDFVRLERFGDRGRTLALDRADKGFQGHLRNFFAAVRAEGPLGTTVEDGVRVAQIIDAFARRTTRAP